MDADQKWEERRQRWEARRQRWEERRHRRGGRFVVGGLIIFIGVLFLLQNLGVFYVDQVWQYWPVILIVVGLSRLSTCRSVGGRIWFGMVVVLGGALLLHNLGFIRGSAWNLTWPILLIGFGFSMLMRGIGRDHFWACGSLKQDAGPANPAPASGSSANTLNEWAIFGGSRRRIESQEFEGGEAVAVFGGVELDLRKAATKKEEIVIEANAVFGGIDIRAPEHWKIVVRGAGIFGGYEDKSTDSRPGENGKRPTLVITGYAFFGGVTVQN
jgi:predicted membrane protein